ncbi:MAG: NAD(P)H-dependent glycerol-3-phosphate dehydrogenase [Dehalococcoidia bacterium]|nr:NAD(P)H-dependent glycerol-3-phosphate dehydrogenase [Dehalococcoidia bacterium]
MKVAVIGTTSWGTTQAIMLSRRGFEVSMWARTEAEARRLRADRQNSRMMPGFPFPDGLLVTASAASALRGAAMVIFAVPSQSLRENVKAVGKHIGGAMIVLSGVKGLEVGSRKRMSEVIADELPISLHNNIAVLSGPNLALEIARGLPAASVIAARHEDVARNAQQIMMSPSFRVYTSDDVVGVELGGALKNIIALGAGMSDGMGYGDNAKAGFMTRGLAEISRLGVAMGAKPLTLAGLAGLGDLVATCSSSLSRNHFLGCELAKGRSLDEVTSSMKGVAEGITTTAAARQMAHCMGIGMPITEQIYRVLFEGLGLRQAITELMGREPKPETSR